MRHSKIFLAVLIIVVVLISVVSCKSNVSNTQLPQNSPAYLKNVYNTLNEEGIKVIYNPKVLKPIPAPQKPYSPFPRNIPGNWIIGDLEWTQYKLPNSQYGFVSLAGFYDNFIVETVPDKSYKAPPSRPNSIKPILKLYRRKNISEPISGKLTKSDYTLLKVLDKAPVDYAYPQNQTPVLSDRFIVWQASSDESNKDWEIWSYDIQKDKIFPVCSYKDYKLADNVYPVYTISKGKDFLLINFITRSDDGKLTSEVIIYDLANEKIYRVVKSEKYVYSSPELLGNYLYANRANFYQNRANETHYKLSSVVKINLDTNKEDVVIPNANLLVADSFQYKICLISVDPGYKYNDVWVLNTKANILKCYIKIPVDDNNVMPGASLTEKGILYAGGQPKQTPYYFYSFSKSKAFYTGPQVTRPDNEGRFLIMKQPLDIYYPIPPFNYKGREKRLEGYNTFLIIKPD